MMFNTGSRVRLRTTRSFPRKFVPAEKTIPLWVLKTCRQVELRALLSGMMSGDGTWRVENSSGTYYTSEQELADRVQYLLSISGFRSHIRLRRGSSYEIQFSDNRFVDVIAGNIKIVPYSGRTWCVSTDLGSIMTRRKGAVAIVGNSSTDKCEVLCVDDNFVWFWGKYKHFAPKWFQERVRGSLTCVPDPPV